MANLAFGSHRLLSRPFIDIQSSAPTYADPHQVRAGRVAPRSEVELCRICFQMHHTKHHGWWCKFCLWISDMLLLHVCSLFSLLACSSGWQALLDPSRMLISQQAALLIEIFHILMLSCQLSAQKRILLRGASIAQQHYQYLVCCISSNQDIIHWDSTCFD